MLLYYEDTNRFHLSQGFAQYRASVLAVLNRRFLLLKQVMRIHITKERKKERNCFLLALLGCVA
jgi:hypothetical protein